MLIADYPKLVTKRHNSAHYFDHISLAPPPPVATKLGRLVIYELLSKGTNMKRTTINQSVVNQGSMRRKMDAAGSEQGQQIIPAIVGIIWFFNL